MRKRISIAGVVLAAMLAGGCRHGDLFARLSGLTDHIRLVRTEAGFLGVAIALEIDKNPFDVLPLLK